MNNRRVFKYTVLNLMMLPEGWKKLAVAEQAGAIQLWAEVDPGATLVEVDGTALLEEVQNTEYRVFMTGDEIPNGWEYVITQFSHDNRQTAHIYRLASMPIPPDADTGDGTVH